MDRRRRLGIGLLALVFAAAGLMHAVRADADSLAPLAAENVEYVTGHNAFTGGHVVVEGKRLYVGAYGAGMRIFDIADPAHPVLIGEYHPGSQDWDPELDDHFHAVHADAVPDAARWNGREIAVLNGTRRVTQHDHVRTDHTDFFDATDPGDLKRLWTFVGKTYGEAHNGDVVDVRKLWLPSGGAGCDTMEGDKCVKHRGLRIFDLTPLLQQTPAEPEALVMVDPVELWKNSPYRDGRPVGPNFTHTHDITVYTDYPVKGRGERDIALLAEGGSYTNDNGNTGSIFVIDITDPRNPVALQRWIHQSGAGHHPIRYNHEAQFLASDPRVMLVTDEDLHAGAGCTGAGGVTAVRLSDDLTHATELSEWFIPFGTPAATCSVHVFSSHGSLVFFGSYNAGLQVVDYSDPQNPKRVGQYVAEGTTAWGAQYHKGYVYIGDMSRGLDVVKWLDSEKKNKIKNGSFESSTNSAAPDAWTGSGTTSYTFGGSDGERAVTASADGAWTSEAVEVVAGKSYGFSVDVARGGGTLVIEQIDAAGRVITSLNQLLFATGDGSFQTLTGSLRAADGVTRLRVRLNGSLLSATTFDNVQLWEE